MGQIVITLETDNDAFGIDQWEVAQELSSILRRLATQVLENEVVEDTKLMDSNGNTVGLLEVKE